MNKEKQLLDTLITNPKVIKALEYIKENNLSGIEEQLDLTAIEAPTFHEENKGQAIIALFKKYGLSDCHADSIKNAIGYLKNDPLAPTYIMEAHMDTVFPLGTVTKRPKIAPDGNIYCPGILDNTRGVEIILSCLRALKAADIHLKGNMIFAATAQEEGAGSLGGMKQLIKDHPNFKADLSVDGGGFKAITFNATGVLTKRYTFHGQSGHSFGAFSLIAQAPHAMGRAIAKIADMTVPVDNPKSCFAVTSVKGGSFEGLHAIPDEVSFIINFRSDDGEVLKRIENEVEENVRQACLEENAKWQKPGEITYTSEILCEMAAGQQDKDTPLVRADAEVIRYLGEEPIYTTGGCCNSNVPIGLGKPAICIGGGMNTETYVHSLKELFPTKDSHLATQAAFLLLLMMAGSDINPSIYD